MRHKDNTGAEGVLSPGGVQWMTAGRGIIHSEMPEQSEGEMMGFQLWVNLPAADKMTAPRYQNIEPSESPLTTLEDGVSLRVIAGTAADITGPVSGISVDPLYIDITLPAGGSITQPVTSGHTGFAYVFDGEAQIEGSQIDLHTLAVLGDGDQVTISSDTGARVILVAGRPIGEPVARYGPFVMNTKQEIHQAIEDYNNGRF